MNKKYIVRLSDEERGVCQEIVKRLKGTSEKVKRAQILLRADADGPGWPDAQIAEAHSCSVRTVENLRERLVTEGFEAALERKKRVTAPTPSKLDGEGEAKLIALRLGKPLAGYGRWSLQLLADELVALEVVDSICPETVRKTLKKTRVANLARRSCVEEGKLREEGSAMPRTRCRPRPTRVQTLKPVTTHCPECGHRLDFDYANYRTVTTLDAITRLTLQIRRCPQPDCLRYHQPFRPEAEPHFALPHHEFGLDVIALVGRLRYAEHRSVPEIHRERRRRAVAIAQRTVTNLLDRYDELRALATADPQRLRRLLKGQKRVILAIDGLQPDVGHEILWVLRDCLSGEVLLARSLLSATIRDLSALLGEVRGALLVPITGVISDGQDTIRKAVAQELPGVPHQLCHFHYLRDAAQPIYEADRHAKKELKKRVRGVRAIERTVEGDDEEEAEIVRGYCAAVRAAVTDDGRPPLVAPGLVRHDRLEAIAASLDRVAARAKTLPGGLKRLRQLLRRGLEETAALWPAVRVAYRWVQQVARLLKNREQRPVAEVRRGRSRILSGMRQVAAQTEADELRQQMRQFVKVTQSFRPGLFHCYRSADLPRTNNDLEQLFGSHRYHERRASGRKGASPSLVVAGSVKVVAGLATRLRPEEGLELPTGYVARWRETRAGLNKRREARRQQRRFRRAPVTYLQKLEELADKLSLPP